MVVLAERRQTMSDKLVFISRLILGMCIAAIVVLSLLPSHRLVRTNLGEHAEHVLAYLIAALFFAGATRGYAISSNALLLIACAAVLEALQRFSPGRDPNFEDFIFSAIGVFIGALLSAAVSWRQWLWQRCVSSRQRNCVK